MRRWSSRSTCRPRDHAARRGARETDLKRVYTAWSEVAGGPITGFWRGEERPTTGNGDPLAECVFAAWRVTAGSHEEAMAIYNIRMGFGPYEPLGNAAPCPACGAAYWPQGSAQCWNCDHEG